MSIPMKKYSADIHGEFENNSDIGDGAVYLASDVDARIAEMERLLREAEAMLCDERAGEAANELARRIIKACSL